MGKKRLGIMARMAKRILVPILLKRLQNQKFRDRIVTMLNRRLDIPRMDEAQERRFFGTLYDALGDMLINILDDND